MKGLHAMHLDLHGDVDILKERLALYLTVEHDFDSVVQEEKRQAQMRNSTDLRESARFFDLNGNQLKVEHRPRMPPRARLPL
jgi:hypothetical protein